MGEAAVRMTPELLIIITLLILLLAYVLIFGLGGKSIRHERARQRRIRNRLNEPPPDEQDAAGGNQTS